MDTYRNFPVLITGGLGFIGSNLAIRLVEEGAEVTIVDSSVPGCGANPYNLAPVCDRVRVIPQDIGDTENFADAIGAARVIFNLAGEISHVHSMDFPERDARINAAAQLRFLLGCQASNPGVRVVYASTRQIYGVPNYLPVDERHPIQPVDFNGVHKYVASMYHMLLSRTGAIDAVLLRLTNVYGPRMALDIPCQGFLNTFLRNMVLGRPLDVFGDGRQLRDPMYVDDAVEAFLAAGSVTPTPSRTYNIGGPEPLTLNEIASAASAVAGLDPPVSRPFPDRIKAINIGSYYSDSSLAEKELGWRARITFEEGIRRTLDYFRREMCHYLDAKHPDPACRMPEHTGRDCGPKCSGK